MTGSRQAVCRDEGLPIAAIARDGRLTFPTTQDFDRAWELGIFYLAVPEHLDLESARQFGSELLARNSPYRSIQQYGALEGFIALKNNQQTKLALRRHHWDQHYPAAITSLVANSTVLVLPSFAKCCFNLAFLNHCGTVRRAAIPRGRGRRF